MDINAIVAKDPSELTKEELDALVEWRVENALREKKALQEHEDRIAAYNALIDIQKEAADNNLQVLLEMQQAAMERFERAGNGQA